MSQFQPPYRTLEACGKMMQNVNGEIEQIKRRLDALESLKFYKYNKACVVEKEVDLPDHLYRTWHALKHHPEGATASGIAEITERERAVESAYLNALVVMELAKKRRVGRKVIFTLAQKES
jgi:hypothetical protein